MNVEEMRARLAEIETERRSIHTAAGDNPLDTEQQTRWEELDTEETELREALAEAEEAEARSRRVAESRARYGARMGTEDPLAEPNGIVTPRRGNPWDLDQVTRSLYQDTPERGGAELRSRALSAVETVQGLSDRSRQHITGLLEGLDFEDGEEEGRGARQVAAHIVATSSPEYLRAWSKAFKTGMRTGQPDVTALGVLQRAASLTDAAGGFAVPITIDPTLILNADGAVSPLRRIATIRTTVTDQLRLLDVTAVTASYDDEGSEVSDDTPTWDAPEIPVHMARAFIPHSIEIGMDYPGFSQDIAFLLQDSKATLEANKFVLGSGTKEPTGIVTALTGTASEIAAATDDTLALEDIYTLDEELPERFYDNAQWLAHKKIYSAIRQAGGANLDDFWANMGQGQPPQLLGHPVNNASAMDGTVDAVTDNRVAILGDFRWFYIVDRIGFSMELIPHLFHTTTNRPSGQRGVFAYWRNGSDSVLDRAFRLLKV